MAWITNAQHIDLKRSQAIWNKGNYDTLHDLVQKKEVVRMSLIDADIAFAGNHVEIDNTLVTGNVAVWLATTQDNGWIMAAATADSSVATTDVVSDSYGNILNMIEVVDADTRDPILNDAGRKIYWLLQTDAVDWTAIGWTWAENLCISLVVMGEDGALTLESYTGNVDFSVNKVYAMKNDATILLRDWFKGKPDVIKAESVEPEIRKYEVTTAFVANEVITITTGAWATAWVTTVTWDTVATLWATANEFNDNNLRQVRLIGVGCVSKWTYAIRDSATSFHFSEPLSVWDRFEIIVESNN